MSPALAGGLFTTEPPEKSSILFCFVLFYTGLSLFLSMAGNRPLKVFRDFNFRGGKSG